MHKLSILFSSQTGKSSSTTETTNWKINTILLANTARISIWASQEACHYSPVLKFYDASEKGLGATLLQKGQPVAFASRALNKTKQTYRANYIIVWLQIEKECMAILFAFERFNQYLHEGDTITVSTDHKPLVPIFTISIFKAPKQL